MGRGTRTSAIVLRTRPYREVDRIAVLLTREMGKVDALAAGARRPHGALRRLVLPLQESEVWIETRAGKTLGVLTGGRPGERLIGDAAAAEPAVFSAAGQMLELVERFAPPADPLPVVYDLTRAGLSAIGWSATASRQTLRTVLAAFTLKLLAHTGFRVPLHVCARCDSRSAAGCFDESVGAFVCRRCLPAPTPDGEALLAELRRLERARLDDVARGAFAVDSERIARSVRSIAEGVLEAPLRSERVLAALA